MKTNVRDTSIAVYRGRIRGDVANNQAQQALGVIKRMGRCTRKQVSLELGWQDNITARAVNQLLNDSCPAVVKDEAIEPCPVTGVRVHWVEFVGHGNSDAESSEERP